ncbi:MAG: hypothetical protein GC188_10990 [Alphaproteobacteria bacterium]|nr:hypothetical protein [Alphaproteobacteria bacterium]
MIPVTECDKVLFLDDGEVVVTAEGPDFAEALGNNRAIQPVAPVAELLTFHKQYGYIWRAEYEGLPGLYEHIVLNVVVMGHDQPFRNATLCSRVLMASDPRIADYRAGIEH